MVLPQILATLLAASPVAQNLPAGETPDCWEWHECRQMAMDAYGRGEYERFHDLAWRTVQTGRTRDPDLMYLVARAQSLSGRPHDALVMLGRLADMGVASDAATNDDFRAVRTLDEWPRLRVVILTVAASAPPFDPAELAGSRPSSVRSRRQALAKTAAPGARSVGSAAATSGPAAAGMSSVATTVPSASLSPLLTAEEAVRFPSALLNPAGLGYDRVSGRFVIADRRERKLLIVDERSHHVVDLVDAASAGFYDITALEIDSRRGDLWVVSATEAGADGTPATALHKLQLVSGRPLFSLPLPGQFGPARFTDVAVSPDGTVFVLDTAGARIFSLHPGRQRFTLSKILEVEHPTSIAPVDGQTLYVAHQTGIVRVDLGKESIIAVRGRKDAPLDGFERVRWDGDALIGIQRTGAGLQRAVRVKLSRDRQRVRGLDIVRPDEPIAEPTAAAVLDDVFYFLTREAEENRPDDLVVWRARLR
jgi:hypothetical protein